MEKVVTSDKYNGLIKINIFDISRAHYALLYYKKRIVFFFVLSLYTYAFFMIFYILFIDGDYLLFSVVLLFIVLNHIYGVYKVYKVTPAFRSPQYFLFEDEYITVESQGKKITFKWEFFIGYYELFGVIILSSSQYGRVILPKRYLGDNVLVFVRNKLIKLK
jgi:hypothetical protein